MCLVVPFCQWRRSMISAGCAPKKHLPWVKDPREVCVCLEAYALRLVVLPHLRIIIGKLSKHVAALVVQTFEGAIDVGFEGIPRQ